MADVEELERGWFVLCRDRCTAKRNKIANPRGALWKIRVLNSNHDSWANNSWKPRGFGEDSSRVLGLCFASWGRPRLCGSFDAALLIGQGGSSSKHADDQFFSPLGLRRVELLPFSLMSALSYLEVGLSDFMFVFTALNMCKVYFEAGIPSHFCTCDYLLSHSFFFFIPWFVPLNHSR